MSRRNIEKCNFVGTRIVIAFRNLNRIARVSNAYKVDPFDNTPLVNVKARNNALCQWH
jgi:hypothetical protein